MKHKKYSITIDGNQMISGEHSKLSLFTLGDYTRADGNQVISYDESEATGFDGVRTTLTADSDRRVTIRRDGKTCSNLILEKSRRNVCHYNTEFGGLMLGVSASDIVNKLGEKGGTLSFKYTLDVDANTFCENEISITVRENTDE